MDLDLDRLIALEAKATKGPWKFYQPSEHPRDFRVSRDGRAGELGPGTRDYIGRFTTSHDPKTSGNGGRALEGPLRCDIEVLVALRNAAPALLAAAQEAKELRARVAAMEKALVAIRPTMIDASQLINGWKTTSAGEWSSWDENVAWRTARALAAIDLALADAKETKGPVTEPKKGNQ